MKTKNIANKTNTPLIDPVKHLTRIPRVVVAMAKEFPDGHRIPLHRHDRAQLLYASKGVMTVSTEYGLWVVPPLRAVWIPAEIEHAIECAGNLSMRTLYIKPDALPWGTLPGKCCVVSISPLMRELILFATTLPPMDGPDSLEARVMQLMLDLIQTLDVAPLDLPIPRDKRLQKIFREFVKNPADNRTLEDWGKLVGATNRTLARRFKSETQMTFHQWRQQVRILEALKRLGRGEPVTAIALDIGYESPSAFIAMFKKALGKTPGQYFGE